MCNANMSYKHHDTPIYSEASTAYENPCAEHEAKDFSTPDAWRGSTRKSALKEASHLFPARHAVQNNLPRAAAECLLVFLEGDTLHNTETLPQGGFGNETFASINDWAASSQALVICSGAI